MATVTNGQTDFASELALFREAFALYTNEGIEGAFIDHKADQLTQICERYFVVVKDWVGRVIDGKTPFAEEKEATFKGLGKDLAGTAYLFIELLKKEEARIGFLHNRGRAEKSLKDLQGFLKRWTSPRKSRCPSLLKGIDFSKIDSAVA